MFVRGAFENGYHKQTILHHIKTPEISIYFSYFENKIKKYPFVELSMMIDEIDSKHSRNDKDNVLNNILMQKFLFKDFLKKSYNYFHPPY